MFGKKSCNGLNRDRLLEEIQAAQQKCLRLKNKFLDRSSVEESEENNRLALSCLQCANIFADCAELVAQMLQPRDRFRARIFDMKTKKLLSDAEEAFRDCEIFDHPIDTKLVPITNELKSLIMEITAI